MSKNYIIGTVAGLVVVGGVAFYSGMAYAGTQQTPARGQIGGGTGQYFTRTGGMGMGGKAGGGFTAGSVVSVSTGSMTIQSAQSSSTEIVLLGNSTQIFKTVQGSASDLTPGTTVVVTGSQNSDGSLTAQSVQIRPAGAGFFGGRAQGSAQ